MDSLEKFCVDRALQNEAVKQGLVDSTAGLLAGRAEIYVAEDGTVFGADAAVSELLETKPHLARASEPQPQSGQPAPFQSAQDRLQSVGREEMSKRLADFHNEFGCSNFRDQRDLDHTFQPGKQAVANQNDIDQKRIQDFLGQYS